MRGYLTAFDGLVLDDGTNRFAQSLIIPLVTVAWQPLMLVNGGLYDPLGTHDAPTRPAAFDAWFRFKFTTSALLRAEIAAISAKIGVSGLLTLAQHDGGDNLTCTARLTKLQRPYASRISDKRTDRLILSFQPLDSWS